MATQKMSEIWGGRLQWNVFGSLRMAKIIGLVLINNLKKEIFRGMLINCIICNTTGHLLTFY